MDSQNNVSQIEAQVKEFFKTHGHEITLALGGPTSGPGKLCWECGGKGHTRREHWRMCNRLRKEKKNRKRGLEALADDSAKVQVSSKEGKIQACQRLDSAVLEDHSGSESPTANITVQQGGGDFACRCGNFECNGLQCRSNQEQLDTLFLLKNGDTQDLLRFSSSINLGRETIAKQKALVRRLGCIYQFCFKRTVRTHSCYWRPGI
jgi:hypothetical protein